MTVKTNYKAKMFKRIWQFLTRYSIGPNRSIPYHLGESNPPREFPRTMKEIDDLGKIETAEDLKRIFHR